MKLIHKIFIFILKILGLVTNKKVIYVNPNIELGSSSVLSSFGFWYAGNNYDLTDISYGILNNGEIESEGKFVKSLLDKIILNKKNIVFYDIGANTGYFGILSNFIGKGLVKTHFFEPIDEHIDCIKKSILLNRLENTAFIHQIGLGNENSEKTFFTAGSGSSLDENFLGKDVKGKINIQVRKIDDYKEEKKLENPDFMKIDIEGFEYFALLGGLNTIKESLPVIYIEIAKDLKNIGRDYKNDNFEKIFILLVDLGYTGYLVKDNSKLIEFGKEDFVNSGVNMYLFVNKNKHSYLLN